LGCLVLLGLVGGCNRGDSGSGHPSGAATGSPAASADVKLIKTKTGIEMALLPAGEFLMGDESGEDDEKPAHRVKISSFYVDTSEVTQGAFQAAMGRNPAKWVAPDKPVERVTWLAAIQFCNMRSDKEGLKRCYDLNTLQCDFSADGYRLPTEAEWEYACRAGTTTRCWFGNESADLAKYGWFKGNSEKTTHPVKQKQPNPWGLYDMYGNVAEWCNDFYSDAYDPQAEGKDPRGAASGTERVMRGGSFAAADDACRSSARQSQTPVFADTCFGSETFGFRCVRRAEDVPSPPSP
jgi:formylglycine-generating enzyme required for sulfatase activity